MDRPGQAMLANAAKIMGSLRVLAPHIRCREIRILQAFSLNSCAPAPSPALAMLAPCGHAEAMIFPDKRGIVVLLGFPTFPAVSGG